jgi:elongator complex protein 3
MGGTFLSLDKRYKEEFVNFVYKAIADFGEEFLYFDSKTGEKKINYDKFNDFFEVKTNFGDLERKKRIDEKVLKLKNKNIMNYKYEIKRCESSIIRPIGLTIETKPDWAFEKHCKEALNYGTTRFEVGVQTLNEDCLKKTNRGHTLEDTKKSFQIMKDLCFKINAHMMLGLPASNLEIDENSIVDLFEKSEYRPDMLKIYPCLVSKGTPLYNMWKMGLYKPIDTYKAAQIIARCYGKFPRYVRVMRVQRDIPTQNIDAGVQNSNLRQFVDLEMEKLNIYPREIRSREIGFRQLKGEKVGNFEIKVEGYESSNGKDFFIDFSDENDTMIGFIRLRFPYQTDLIKEIDEKTALIRELHVYGQTIPVGKKDEENKVQHKGYGRRLLEKAEEIAKKNGYEKIAIISGIGVREYYAKFGYKLEGPYMVKKLN